MAWEEGAAGIGMECVDYGNYQEPTRQVLDELHRTKLHFTKQSEDK